MESVAELSRAANLLGLTPIVRPPDHSYTMITKALDAGAQGIMIPRITNAKQVEEVVQIMKYPPVGQRGSALARGPPIELGTIALTYDRSLQAGLASRAATYQTQ